MTVRRARRGDLPRVIEMSIELSRLQEPWRVFRPRPGFAQDLARSFESALADPDAILVVAEVEGEVIGMAAGHLHSPSMFSDERAVELASVYVRPEHRRRGLARELTGWVAAFARGRGVDRVTLKTFAQNGEGMAAWEAMGFEPRSVQMTARVERLAAEEGSARGAWA